LTFGSSLAASTTRNRSRRRKERVGRRQDLVTRANIQSHQGQSGNVIQFGFLFRVAHGGDDLPSL
jgi:hypothetical protein